MSGLPPDERVQFIVEPDPDPNFATCEAEACEAEAGTVDPFCTHHMGNLPPELRNALSDTVTYQDLRDAIWRAAAALAAQEGHAYRRRLFTGEVLDVAAAPVADG